MDFCKHHKALNTVYYFLYGKQEHFGAFKVSSLFYYQHHEIELLKQLDSQIISHSIAVHNGDTSTAQKASLEIKQTRQLIRFLINEDSVCH